MGFLKRIRKVCAVLHTEIWPLFSPSTTAVFAGSACMQPNDWHPLRLGDWQGPGCQDQPLEPLVWNVELARAELFPFSMLMALLKGPSKKLNLTCFRLCTFDSSAVQGQQPASKYRVVMLVVTLLYVK